MNECGTNKSRCHENAHCNNINGDHNCTCNQGYEGNGFNCTVKNINISLWSSYEKNPQFKLFFQIFFFNKLWSCQEKKTFASKAQWYNFLFQSFEKIYVITKKKPVL